MRIGADQATNLQELNDIQTTLAKLNLRYK